MKNWLDKYKGGGELTPKQFTQQYIQSPKYKERLISSGYDPNKEMLQRLDNVNRIKTYGQYGAPSEQKQVEFDQQNMPYTKGGSSYLPGKDAIIIDHKQAQEKNILPQYIEAHEFGHGEVGVTDKTTNGIRNSRLNQQDNNDIINRLSEKANPIYKKVPDEIKADMNSLRYELYNKGIYDAGKENIGNQQLDQLNNSYIKDRLLKNYSEEDLIWLMNNIAMNKGSKLQNTNQFSNFTEDNNWLEKYT